MLPTQIAPRTAAKILRRRLLFWAACIVLASFVASIVFDYYYTPAYQVPTKVVRTLQDNSKLLTDVNPEIRMQAQKFRDAIDAASRNPNSTPELNQLLTTYIPKGSDFARAEELLSAAGFSIEWTRNIPPQPNTTSNLHAIARASHLRYSSTAIILYPERNGEFTFVHELSIKPFVLLW